MISLMTIMGLMAVGGGSFTYLSFPSAINMGIKSMLNLKESGMVYPIYMNPPFQVNSAYSLYEVTNPKEVLKGRKMKLKLRGPFVYKAQVVRGNTAFSKSEDILHFDSGRKLYLDEQNSANMDDEFWMLNPIVPGVVKTVRSMVIDRVPFRRVAEPIIFTSVNALLGTYNERLIAKTTPRQILNGRKVELLEQMTNLADRFGLKSLIPPGPPENTFGLAFVQNETIFQQEIWTGIKTKEKFADVFKWKGKRKMDIWTGKCNIINGTNGELYKPLIEVGQPIKTFIGPLCRTVSLDPVSTDEVVLSTGIKALEYELSPRLFMGAKRNPANKCYCKDVRTYDCQYDGLLAMAPCFFDSPLYFSKANFRDTDRKIRSLVDIDSLNVDAPGKQSFYLDKTTGSVLAVNLTLVAVFKVIKQPYMNEVSDVQNLTYAPLFLVNESVVVPFEMVWQIKALQLMMDYYKPAGFGIATLGLILLLTRFFSKSGTSNKT